METYKQILDYPKYEVSDLGNVRNIKTSLILKPIDNGKGYKLVHLTNNLRRRICLIHRLVMITFNPIDIKLDVNHIDGNKSNNNLSNLEWVTKSENTRHAHLNGLFSSRNKLTIEQVKEIKNLKLSVEYINPRLVAEKYGVKRSVIAKIWSGLLYPYV